MLGTIERTSEIATRLSAVKEAWNSRRAMSLAARREYRDCVGKRRSYEHPPRMADLLRGLVKCQALAEQFRAVERDQSAMRLVKATHGDSYRQTDYHIQIPLVFGCKLPAPRVHTQTVTIDRQSYSVKATVPHPTPEALDALKRHRHLFDWIELWWVPNEVLVEKLPDPDPIVVGCIKIRNDRIYSFELHRWVDETVELGWWSKEGY